MLAALLVALAGTAAWADSNNDFQPQGKGPVFIGHSGDEEALAPEKGWGYTSPQVVPAADFRSDGLDPSGYFFSFAAGGPAGTTCMMAPVYLNNGATISGFWSDIYDNNAGSDLTVYLMRVNAYDNSVAPETVATITTSGASTSPQNVGGYFAGPVADYTHAVYVTTCLVADTRPIMFRVYFTE